MFDSSSFGKTVNILNRSLDVAALRENVIADNIANSETPNFKRSQVSFESQLRMALDSEKVEPPFTIQNSNGFWDKVMKPLDYTDVGPRVTLDYLTSTKNNGNNVDPEQEMMEEVKNVMQYSLLTEALSHQFRTIDIVLK